MLQTLQESQKIKAYEIKNQVKDMIDMDNKRIENERKNFQTITDKKNETIEGLSLQLQNVQ